MTPLWVVQLATGTKSFERNLVIGSRRLNQWGLHAGRVTLVHRLARARRRKLANLVAPQDRDAFARELVGLMRQLRAGLWHLTNTRNSRGRVAGIALGEPGHYATEPF